MTESFTIGGYTSPDGRWWIPTLANGWTDYGAPFSPARYTRITNNLCILKGVVKSGAEGTVIFPLKVGYRPVETHIFPALCGGDQLARITVDPSGNVTATKAPSTSYLSLDGISFVAPNV